MDAVGGISLALEKQVRRDDLIKKLVRMGISVSAEAISTVNGSNTAIFWKIDTKRGSRSMISSVRYSAASLRPPLQLQACPDPTLRVIKCALRAMCSRM
jgi:hypothetical protein